jgi:hypothetical protein
MKSHIREPKVTCGTGEAVRPLEEIAVSADGNPEPLVEIAPPRERLLISEQRVKELPAETHPLGACC